jgi:hypothetical protein
LRIFALWLAFGLVSACGGTVGADSTSRTGGGASGGANGVLGSGGAPGDAGPGTGGSVLHQEAGLTDARYVDPGCPPPMHVQGVHECDPYAPGACGSGRKCSPYVVYADGCQSEETGTRCVISGTRVQGEDCASDSSACAEGFACVSAGTGFQCARLCQLNGATDDCPPGLICSPLDVDGFYVCG